MGTLLCIGGNEHLYSRSLVLQSAGFDVTVATSDAAALASLSSTAPQAVILDSSSTAHPADLAMEIKRIRPAVPILLVLDNAPDGTSEPKIDRTICRLDGPAVLLLTLQELTSGLLTITLINGKAAGGTRLQTNTLRKRLATMRLKLHRLHEALDLTNKLRHGSKKKRI